VASVEWTGENVAGFESDWRPLGGTGLMWHGLNYFFGGYWMDWGRRCRVKLSWVSTFSFFKSDKFIVEICLLLHISRKNADATKQGLIRKVHLKCWNNMNNHFKLLFCKTSRPSGRTASLWSLSVAVPFETINSTRLTGVLESW